jgi:hypothetical protein
MMAGIEKVSIPQLGGNNWSMWKAKIQALLEYKGLMVAVEQPNSVEGRKASRQAKALMILHTEDAYVKLIVGESTAAKAWEKLKHNDETKSNARVVQLAGKLTNMKLGEKQTIAEYLGEFREIKEDLEAAGQTVSDLQLAEHALRGLPKGYETLREILEADHFELRLDTIQPKLMQREETLRLQSENRGVLVDEAQTAAFFAFLLQELEATRGPKSLLEILESGAGAAQVSGVPVLKGERVVHVGKWGTSKQIADFRMQSVTVVDRRGTLKQSAELDKVKKQHLLELHMWWRLRRGKGHSTSGLEFGL